MPRIIPRRGFLAGILLGTALLAGHSGRWLRGSVLDIPGGGVRQIIDADADGTLTPVEMRRSILPVFQGVLRRDASLDLTGEGRVDRRDFWAFMNAVGSLDVFPEASEPPNEWLPEKGALTIRHTVQQDMSVPQYIVNVEVLGALKKQLPAAPSYLSRVILRTEGGTELFRGNAAFFQGRNTFRLGPFPLPLSEETWDDLYVLELTFESGDSRETETYAIAPRIDIPIIYADTAEEGPDGPYAVTIGIRAPISVIPDPSRFPAVTLSLRGQDGSTTFTQEGGLDGNFAGEFVFPAVARGTYRVVATFTVYDRTRNAMVTMPNLVLSHRFTVPAPADPAEKVLTVFPMDATQGAVSDRVFGTPPPRTGATDGYVAIGDSLVHPESAKDYRMPRMYFSPTFTVEDFFADHPLVLAMPDGWLPPNARAVTQVRFQHEGNEYVKQNAAKNLFHYLRAGVGHWLPPGGIHQLAMNARNRDIPAPGSAMNLELFFASPDFDGPSATSPQGFAEGSSFVLLPEDRSSTADLDQTYDRTAVMSLREPSLKIRVRCDDWPCDVPPPICGNGTIDPAGADERRGTPDDEICDDGNREDLDHCSNACRPTGFWWIDAIGTEGPAAASGAGAPSPDIIGPSATLADGRFVQLWADAGHVRASLYEPGAGWTTSPDIGRTEPEFVPPDLRDVTLLADGDRSRFAVLLRQEDSSVTRCFRACLFLVPYDGEAHAWGEPRVVSRSVTAFAADAGEDSLGVTLSDLEGGDRTVALSPVPDPTLVADLAAPDCGACLLDSSQCSALCTARHDTIWRVGGPMTPNVPHQACADLAADGWARWRVMTPAELQEVKRAALHALPGTTFVTMERGQDPPTDPEQWWIRRTYAVGMDGQGNEVHVDADSGELFHAICVQPEREARTCIDGDIEAAAELDGRSDLVKGTVTATHGLAVEEREDACAGEGFVRELTCRHPTESSEILESDVRCLYGCEDGTCRTALPEGTPVPQCQDGEDNDGDGFIDFTGRDTDGDGLPDSFGPAPQDPGCSSTMDPDESDVPSP